MFCGVVEKLLIIAGLRGNTDDLVIGGDIFDAVSAKGANWTPRRPDMNQYWLSCA
ncbi:hypothetical protein THIOSC13_1340006 [uncultured Thiomicrorhabdus sp.]